MKASSRILWRLGLSLGAQAFAALALFAQAPPAKNAPPPQIPPAIRQAAEQFDKAIKLQRERKFPQAISAFTEYIRLGKAAKVAPNALVPAYSNIATLYGAQGAQKEQAETLRELLKLAPTNAGALADLANLDIALGRFEEGRAEAEQVLKAKPNPSITAAARFTLGLYSLQKNDLPKAEEEFLQSAKLMPSNPQTHMNLAIVYAREKKIPLALAAAENARKVAPKLLQPYIFLGNFYRESRNFPKAVQMLDGAIGIDPQNPRLHFEKALLQQQLGDYANALKGYLKVIELEPQNASAYLNAGQIYYGIQNFIASKIQYEAAAKLLPKDIRPIVGAALCDAQIAMNEPTYLKRQEILKRAEDALKRAGTLFPSSPLVQDALLFVYERGNHFEEAQSLMQKRIDKEPDNPQHYNGMARIFRAQRRMDEVVALWKKYRVRKPNDKASYSEAADAYELSGKAAEAIKEWDEYLLKSPKDTHALLQKARILLVLQKFDESDKEYQAVLRVEAEPSANPNGRSLSEVRKVEALRGLANIRRQQRKYEEGAVFLARAKAIDLAHSKTSFVPPSTDIMRDLAALYAVAGKTLDAIREYDDLSLYPPNGATALVEAAKLCDSINDVERARNFYRRAALLSKDPLALLLQTGILYRKRQQFAKELEEYNALLPKYGKESRLHLAFASCYELFQQDEKAAIAYRTAIALDPKLPATQSRLATVYMRLKRYAEARGIYERLIIAEPYNAQHYADLTQVYVAENQRPAYLVWLQKRLEANPTDETLFGFYYEEMERQKGIEATLKYLDDFTAQRKANRKLLELYANTLMLRYRSEKALLILQGVADANPADAPAQTALVAALDKSGKREEGTQRLLALSMRKDLPPSVIIGFKRQVGMRYLDDKKPEAALPYLLEVAKSARNDFQATAIVATMLEKEGREEELIPIYNSTLTLKGQPETLYGEVHKRLARIHAKKGRKAEALAHYKEALRFNPEDGAAKKEAAALDMK